MENQSNQTEFERPPEPRKKGKKTCCLTTLIGLAIVLIFLIAFFIYTFWIASKIRSGEIDPNQINRTIDSNNLNVILPDPFLGPKDANIVITEYSDFQCPACLQAFPAVKEMTREYSDRVKFVFKDFPIIDLHPDALAAALAGQCAHEQDMFWQMHDKMFTHQGSLRPENLKRFAIELGLDSLKFSTCFDSAKYYSSVNGDYQQGRAIGIKSTPTFVINNQIIEGALSIDIFDQIIQQELLKLNSE